MSEPGVVFPDLTRMFSPRSVALLGATEDTAKFGGRLGRQLIDFGYRGEIFPINPRRAEIFGRRCYASVDDLPETPDHVTIALPASAVPEALERCAARGVPFVTVFTAGFGESGTAEGRAAEQRLRDIARAGGMRFMGPNCNGLVNFIDQFALTSTASIRGKGRPRPGDIGVAGQSGGASQVNVMWRAAQAGLGISYQVSCGNAADIDLLDYAHFMLESEHTRVVLVLAERLSDGAKLRALGRRAAELDKPVIMVKIGRTEAGSRAAASHTGAVTGEDAVTDAALAQAGIVRVDDCNELYEAAMLLRRGWRPAGRRASSISISGGNLVMMAEIGAAQGIEWPDYAPQTNARLQELMPDFGKVTNPTDLTAAANGNRDVYATAAGIIVDDPSIDVLIPVMTIATADEIRSIAAMSAASAKPVAMLFTGCAIDDPSLTPESLVAQGHAVYRDATPCARAVRAAMRYGEMRRRLARPAPARPAGIDAAAARALLDGAVGTLSEHRSKALLACYGLPVTREFLARDAGEAVRQAAGIGGPVALKIQSADIPHKTEAGAIRLGVVGDQAVRRAHDEVVAAARAYRPDARIDGVLVQEMVGESIELLAGLSHDATFGAVVTVGLGGIFTEILKDVAVRVPPIGNDDVLAALRELRAYGVLQGARGRPPGDLDALADCLARLSWLAADLGDRIAELDVNPLCVLPRGRGVRVVDALVVLKEAS